MSFTHHNHKVKHQVDYSNSRISNKCIFRLIKDLTEKHNDCEPKMGSNQRSADTFEERNNSNCFPIESDKENLPPLQNKANIILSNAETQTELIHKVTSNDEQISDLVPSNRDNLSNASYLSSLEGYMEERYKKAISDCKTIKKFVDEILERDEYYNEKIAEKAELAEIFEEAAIKTELEKMNLETKGIVNKRYADFMKRLSMNSKTVSAEAISARDNYNKKAKEHNDTIKVLRNINISQDAQIALTNVLVYKDKPKQFNIEPLHITARDFYSSPEYQTVIKRIIDK